MRGSDPGKNTGAGGRCGDLKAAGELREDAILGSYRQEQNSRKKVCARRRN